MDLDQKQIELYKDSRLTFLSTAFGQRVLSDLIEKFLYNDLVAPQSDLDAAIHRGSRDVIRYIIGNLGFGDSETFVKALAMARPVGPDQPLATQSKADTGDE